MIKKRHPIAKIVGENVRALRHNAGMTQTQVANMAGVHLRYIQDIEGCRRNPTVGVVECLKLGFSCEWEDILDKKPAKETAKATAWPRRSAR